MDLLAYWRIDNYRHDLDEGAGFHFNSKQSRLHSAMSVGDTLWLFTRLIGASGHSEFRSEAKLVIRAKTINPPTYEYVESAEAHHIIYRSRGGPDEIENLVLLCPNHHTVIHRADANFDYGKLHFIFANGRVEPLGINTHLKARVLS